MEFEDRAKPNSVRFVLLQHTLPDHSSHKSHWDLMIEAGDFLLTFELQSLPGNVSNSARVAWPTTRLADHRRHYLDYEGVIDPPAQTSSTNKDTNKQAGNRERCTASPQAKPSAKPPRPAGRSTANSIPPN
ncbi:MAG: hypothetical protein R3C56_11515 [Pirellulaceae bacterium]